MMILDHDIMAIKEKGNANKKVQRKEGVSQLRQHIHPSGSVRRPCHPEHRRRAFRRHDLDVIFEYSIKEYCRCENE